MAVPPKVAGPRRFYKDFLTPSLHRRFTKAAVLSLAACYAEAVLLSDKTSLLWFWFPLGYTGIRTLLLFVSVFVIFILRVAQLHVGIRNTASPSQTLQKYTFRKGTLATLIIYLFSAWFFGEIYVWSTDTSADLGWLKVVKLYERDRLNERPIYLKSFFFMLAITQSFVHLYRDYDRIVIPVPKFRPDQNLEDHPAAATPPLERIKGRLLPIAIEAVTTALATMLAGPFIYYFFLRKTLWKWHLFFAQHIWSLRSETQPPNTLPFHITILGRSLWTGMLLLALWKLANLFFGSYVTLEPLKKGQPLSSDSKDPNGALINGLKSKKSVPRAFAFWELMYIAYRFPSRRKTIYEELDCNGSSTYSQILGAAYDQINGIESRIKAYQISLSPPPAPPPKYSGNPQPLPRIAKPIHQDPITTNPPPPQTTTAKVGAVAKSISSPGSSPQPHLSPKIKGALQWGVDRTLSPSQKQALSPQHLRDKTSPWLLAFLQSWPGSFFRRTTSRAAHSVILGTPYGDAGVLCAAIDSAARLAVCSLDEDPYGKVQGSVGTLMTDLRRILGAVQAFRQDVKVHWTDVEFVEEERDKWEGINQVEQCLKYALGSLVTAFGGFARELRVSEAEMRKAREAVAA